MKRLPDWDLRFEAFIASRYRTPFAWGGNDCAIFAADCIHAMTGVDPAPAGLRDHRTEKQAMRALKRHGGLAGIATAALGQPISALMASVGDVVLCHHLGRDLLAVCNGGTCLAPSKSGLVSLGMDTCTAAWRVV